MNIIGNIFLGILKVVLIPIFIVLMALNVITTIAVGIIQLLAGILTTLGIIIIICDIFKMGLWNAIVSPTGGIVLALTIITILIVIIPAFFIILTDLLLNFFDFWF